ncbi:MAG: hypothetical protein ACD_2C00088G0002 [uncultured bacterium (gcode 4)]|uniref:AB hydrolase-1 domain-containing protein n=1 Tax=uncultured bacterium (gcode 4) TaxID=1234023 RepID=K2G699_9BACT|nr:MAG: hypothetical protein ACD_2C00088G0002 [uncultured bacterium (gcode 4)]
MINTIELKFKDQEIHIEYFYIGNNAENVILFLHWLWACKENFIEVANDDMFRDYNTIWMDFPWTWLSSYIENLKIDDLAEIVNLFLGKLKIRQAVIVWHSMWWVVGLKFAEKFPQSVRWFINIEWNLISKDASFSKYLTALSLSDFIKEFGDEKSMHVLSFSLVEESENWDLLNKFINLNLPKLYIYWINSHILALDSLTDSWVETAWIGNSWHHPFLENKDDFKVSLLKFLKDI